MRSSTKILRFCRASSALLIVAVALPLFSAGAQYLRFGQNRVQYESHDWKYIQSDHFDIYFYEESSDLASFTASVAEEAYSRIAALLNYQLQHRVPIIVYINKSDFGVTNAVDLPINSESIGGVTELYKNRVALPFNGDYADYKRVLHHELVHAVLNDYIYGGSLQALVQSNLSRRLPSWFGEGLAEYSSDGWGTSADMYMRDAVLTSSLPSVQDLRGYYAYRGGQSFWDYVASQYGQQKVAEIVEQVKSDRSLERVFKSSTGLSLDELSAAWRNALEEIHFPEVVARDRVDILGRPIVTDKNGLYNASPSLSPQGNELAFVSTNTGLFDVYLVNTVGVPQFRRIANGQSSTYFQKIRVQSPGITWSSDGSQLAVIASSGPTETVVLIDRRTRKKRRIGVPGVDRISAISWSPDGKSIAFSASAADRSDIYILDLETGSARPVTNDLYSDHEPAWSPDGSSLVFHSDRDSEATQARLTPRESQDVYRISLRTGIIDRLTTSNGYNSESAQFSRDGTKVIFLSDKNGVNNLYAIDLATRRVTPLTNLLRGIMQYSLSADESRVAIMALEKGVPHIYIVSNLISSGRFTGELQPNLWHHRRTSESDSSLAPAALLAVSNARSKNPFLRDAASGVSFYDTYQADRERIAYVGPAEVVAPGDTTVSFSLVDPQRDTVGVRVGFRPSSPSAVSIPPNASVMPAHDLAPDSTGLASTDYKLKFSPDIVYGTAGYDVLYGAQGVTEMRFSDMLGNHRFAMATNLLVDLRNADYIMSYEYLSNRTDWRADIFQLSRLLPDEIDVATTFQRFRQYGVSATATYPISTFRRVEGRLSFVVASQADITNVRIPATNRTFVYPSVSYTYDAAAPSFGSPKVGRRFAASIAGSPFSLGGESAEFATVLTEGRFYTRLSQSLTLATRFSSGVSLGKNTQLFYSSGVQNWINRDFDDQNGFPVQGLADFIFATPIYPVRGFEINERNGSRFTLVNVEMRRPLTASNSRRSVFFSYLDAVAFADVGAMWAADSTDRTLRLFETDETGVEVFRDLMIGLGFGARTAILGYPIRLDYGWPYDGNELGKGRLYLSVGFDF